MIEVEIVDNPKLEGFVGMVLELPRGKAVRIIDSTIKLATLRYRVDKINKMGPAKFSVLVREGFYFVTRKDNQ